MYCAHWRAQPVPMRLGGSAFGAESQGHGAPGESDAAAAAGNGPALLHSGQQAPDDQQSAADRCGAGTGTQGIAAVRFELLLPAVHLPNWLTMLSQ